MTHLTPQARELERLRAWRSALPWHVSIAFVLLILLPGVLVAAGVLFILARMLNSLPPSTPNR